jgi:hypothetical protein
MQKNVASQKWTVFAFDRTDNSPQTGDAANITANIKIDGGAAGATNDTNPTELEDGYYEFDLTQAETNGNLLQLFPASGTADIQVIGVPGAIYTRQPVIASLWRRLLDKSAGTIVAGTVSHDNTAASTTVFYSDDITEATADHFNGTRIVIFTSGVLQYQATDITDYALVSGEGQFTVTALTEYGRRQRHFCDSI